MNGPTQNARELTESSNTFRTVPYKRFCIMEKKKEVCSFVVSVIGHRRSPKVSSSDFFQFLVSESYLQL